MSKGRRYDKEPKLNMKKVFAVIIAILVIIMSILMIKGIFSNKNTKKISSLSYFSFYKDNKWGIIDSNGNVVIDPSYKEMIVVPNNKTAVFLCTYDVNYETGEYKTKALNEKNEEIFKNYDEIEAIQNKNDSSNYWYEKNVLKVKQGNFYGLINLSGKEILASQYDEIVAMEGIENCYKIKKDGKIGIVDGDGKIVLTPEYEDVGILGKDNKSGFIIKKDNKYGIIDYSKNIILDTKYDEIKKVYGNDCYVVVENGTKKLVKKDGTDLLTSGFDEITQVLASQENAVIFKKSEKYGIMDLAGKVVIEPQYEDLKEARTGIFIAKKDGQYGIVNMLNTTAIEFKYANIAYQEKADLYIADDKDGNTNILDSNLETKISGILVDFNIDKGYLKLRQDDDYKYYNFKFEEKKEVDFYPNRTLYLSKKDGKYGFVDKNGKVIVDYIYDDATEQNDYGFAGVKKDGKWGAINSTGAVIQEPTYNLDNYLLVDFIGRWHLGTDINMNYYNQE